MGRVTKRATMQARVPMQMRVGLQARVPMQTRVGYADAGRFAKRSTQCRTFSRNLALREETAPQCRKLASLEGCCRSDSPRFCVFLYVFRGVSTHIFLVLKEGLTPCIQSFFRCLKDCLKNFLPSSALRPRFCFETRFFSQSSALRGCFCLSPVSNHSGLCFGPRFCLEPALTAFPAESR